MAELIDIYDASLRPLGAMERVEAHKKGQWHQTFHCWIVNPLEKFIVFQVRSQTTATHPGKLDVSAAGHLATGEAVEDGVREVEEELGIEVTINDLEYAGKRVEVSDSASGIKNREYQSVYFLSSKISITEFKPDPMEVSGLAAIPIADGLRLFSGALSSVTVPVVDVQPNGKLILRNRTLREEDFIPRIQRYYLTAIIMAERLTEGRLPLAIS